MSPLLFSDSLTPHLKSFWSCLYHLQSWDGQKLSWSTAYMHCVKKGSLSLPSLQMQAADISYLHRLALVFLKDRANLSLVNQRSQLRLFVTTGPTAAFTPHIFSVASFSPWYFSSFLCSFFLSLLSFVIVTSTKTTVFSCDRHYVRLITSLSVWICKFHIILTYL